MTAERDKFSEFDEPGFDPIVPQDDDDQIAAEQKARMTGEPMVPKSRLDEVIQQRDRAEARREEVIRQMLTPAQQQQPQQRPLPDGLDEEVVKAVNPLLDHRLTQEREQLIAGIRQEFEQRYGTVLRRAERDMNLSEMDERVPGFKDELYEDVKSMWQQMPPEQRREYDSKAGMEALALKARLQRLEGKRGSDMSGMAYSATAQPVPNQSGGPTEEDIWRMPLDEFRRRYPAGG